MITQKDDPYIKPFSNLPVLKFITVQYFCISLVKPHHTENNDSSIIYGSPVTTILGVLQSTGFHRGSTCNTRTKYSMSVLTTGRAK